MQALSDPDLMQRRMEYIALCPAEVEFTEYENCRRADDCKIQYLNEAFHMQPCLHELCERRHMNADVTTADVEVIWT